MLVKTSARNIFVQQRSPTMPNIPSDNPFVVLDQKSEDHVEHVCGASAEEYEEYTQAVAWLRFAAKRGMGYPRIAAAARRWAPLMTDMFRLVHP